MLANLHFYRLCFKVQLNQISSRTNSCLNDYRDIISKSVSPVEFSSKKDLFFKLCTPLLIDGSKKTFSIDKYTNKKCYILSARELSITWGSNPLYWSWKPLLHSRFSEGVELIMASWLEIHGKVNNLMLSDNTTYGAYLIVKLADRAFGLDSFPPEVSFQVGDGNKIIGKTYLRDNKGRREESKNMSKRLGGSAHSEYLT